MQICVISFTEKGYELGERVASRVARHQFRQVFRGGQRESLVDFCRNAFRENMALLFIGAIGIAVRSIAPSVKDKLKDPPVVVMDEAGKFCIPLLSGHMGGANELALAIADAVGAVPVITTATDVQGAFSVDLFAKERQLEIVNRDGIARVSGKALEGKPITISVKDYPPEVPVDVMVTDDTEEGQTTAQRMESDSGSQADVRISGDALESPENTREMDGMRKSPVDAPVPSDVSGKSVGIVLKKDSKDTAFSFLTVSESRKITGKYVIGIGCKKGKSAAELEAFLLDILRKANIPLGEVGAIATIDRKQDEEGIIEFSRKHCLPLITFEAKMLRRARGAFRASAFVEEVTGVDNVCERAAVLAAGTDAKLIVKKTARDGMTAAVARSFDMRQD